MKIFYPEPTERRRRLIARWLRKYRCLHGMEWTPVIARK